MKKTFFFFMFVFLFVPKVGAMEVTGANTGFALDEINFFQQMHVADKVGVAEKAVFISVEKNIVMSIYATDKPNHAFPDFVPAEEVVNKNRWQANIKERLANLHQIESLPGKIGLVYVIKNSEAGKDEQYIIYALKKHEQLFYKVEMLVDKKYLAKGKSIVINVIETILPLGNEYMQQSMQRMERS